MPKPYFYDTSKHIAEMLRVDHAGEYGAVRIYQGQLAAMHNPVIESMLQQEQRHLEYFVNEMQTRKIRPTLLLPFWHVIGYVLGNTSARLGIKTAMILTQSVEEVIEKHYAGQLDTLNIINEPELYKNISQFRLEEIEHKDIAVNDVGKHSLINTVLSNLIKTACKIAIYSSTRL